MRNLNKTEIKAVEKVGKKFNFFSLTQANGGLSNGELLDLIRYCKRLNLKPRPKRKSK